jgi:hypothetical protein
MKRIEVNCYSGHRGEERPLSFIYIDKSFRVVDILERRLEEDQSSRERRRFYKIKANDGKIYTLIHMEVKNEWILMRTSEDARG